MKRSRFSEEQIITILKEHEADIIKADVYRLAPTNCEMQYKESLYSAGGLNPARVGQLS